MGGNRSSHSRMTLIRTLILLLAIALTGSLIGLDGAPVADVAARTEVVVTLASPPLSRTAAGASRIDAEQAAFEQAVARELPEARLRWRYRLVANGFAVDLPSGDIDRLGELPGVRDVFPSAPYGAQLDESPRQIGAGALWGAGLETAGDGMKIGIIDTGVDPEHAFFDPRGYTMPAGFPKGQLQYTSAKVIVARAFAPPGAQTQAARRAFDSAESGHGTHVAGISAGNAGTRTSGGRTVSGVAPRAYIGNYKALVRTDSGLSPNGNSPELVAAIEAAVADGMDVINLSLGEPEIEPRRDIVALALDAAARAGVVPVVAAGNDYNDAGAGSVSSPANSARAITVAAVETEGTPPASTHAEFSSVGPTTISLRMKPDVAAPGVDILSSVPEGWASFSGTSMATPHVSGAAALLKERHREWTVAQVKSALVQTGSDARDGGKRRLSPPFQGGGVVSLATADRPLLFAEPSGVTLELLARGGTVRGQIQLADAGSGAGTWQAAVVRRGRAGSGRFSVPASVTVPGTLEYVASATARAPAGDLSGYVELRRGTDVRRVPFWGRITMAALGRHRVLPLRRPGSHRATTAGRPALVSRYRYPESPSGLGVTTMLRGPELVYRLRLAKPVANFGVVVTGLAPGAQVQPRVVAGLDENRLTGYAGLPVAHNPYLDSFRQTVPAAGALSPRPGDYAIVFDSGGRAGAGRFTFRYWVNDVTAPVLRLRTRSLASGASLLVRATDAGSGVDPGSIAATVDGEKSETSFRRGVVSISTGTLAPGPHRLRLRVSDYQETKNTENVARILPNTRTLTTTFTVSP
jgi:subtilisin family serine protease